MTLKRISLVALLLPTFVAANTPFDGEWTLRPQLSRLPPEPEEYSLSAGLYKCSTCVPRLEIPADGAEHPVVGAPPDFDSLIVRIVNSRTVRLEQRRAGQSIREETYRVAPDDSTMTLAFSDRSAPKIVSGSVSYQREGAVVPGAHLLSGSWRAARLLDLGASGSRLSVSSTENGLRMIAGDGRGFDAKFDLKDYPVSGAAVNSSVALARLNPLAVQINHKQGGAIVSVIRATVSADGEQLTVIRADRRRARATTLVYGKESHSSSAAEKMKTP